MTESGFFRPKVVRKGFIDDHHWLGGGSFAAIEQATFDQSDLERL
jgi:hypothetical protein